MATTGTEIDIMFYGQILFTSFNVINDLSYILVSFTEVYIIGVLYKYLVFSFARTEGIGGFISHPSDRVGNLSAQNIVS